MKHCFTLLVIALMSSASAQTVLPPTYPYNPDSDGDEFVAVSDVLMSVASYDDQFQAMSIMVDTLSLEEAIEILLQRQAQNQQELIHGISSALSNVEGFDPCPLQWSCGCPWSYQGYDYTTVQIGEQCWFAENLKASSFLNGESIPVATEESPLHTMGQSGKVSYEYDEGLVDTWGWIYNGFVAIDSRGICPLGWSVPTDDDIKALELEMGMTPVQVDESGWRGLEEGFALKSNSEEFPNWNGSNTSGFSAIPSGLHYDYFAGLQSEFVVWCSDGLGWNSDNYYRALTSGGGIYRGTHNIADGHSIRCLRDSE